MSTTMVTAANLLKEVYEPRLVDQLQSDVTTLRRVERSSEGISQDVGGKYTVFPVRVKRNHGVGARNEMDPLPTARSQGYEDARVSLKHFYGAVQFTGQTFELAKTNPQSFVNVVDEEVKGLRETVAKDQNRQMYGSPTGTLATATGAGSTTTIATDNTQYVEVGMYVDVYDETNTLDTANVEVTAVTDTLITLGTAVTSTIAGYTITRNGSRGKEANGFDSIMDIAGGGVSELYNIVHATWTPNLTDLSGALSEAAMIAMAHKIRRRGGKTTVIFTSEGVQRAYFNLLTQQRRFTDTTDFAGGFRGLTFTADGQDIPVVVDWDCQPGRMYFINEKELKFYREGDWSFMNRDGSMWFRISDSSGRYDAYGADLFMYGELGTHRRNSHGVIYNIDEPAA